MKRAAQIAGLVVMFIGGRAFFASAEEKGLLKDINISGFVDVYYSVNFNTPDTRANQLRNFDIRENQTALNLAELVIEKKPERLGFRIDLDFGPTTDWVHANATPLTNEAETFKHIQQAFLSYKTPNGITVDLGKFVTHLGAEVIETKDNWNYSRSLLFAWAIPYFHAGVRANLPITDSLFANLFFYNGDTIVTDNNDSKTFGVQIGVTPFPRLSIIQNWIGGPEQATSESNWRHIFDTVATLSVTDRLTLLVNFDYGTEAFDTPTTETDSHWIGVATYARYAYSERAAFILRWEWLNDNDGIRILRTGSAFLPGASLPAQEVQEFTFTVEDKILDNLLFRLEYRRDWSTQDVFDEDAKVGPTGQDSQDTLLLGAVVAF